MLDFRAVSDQRAELYNRVGDAFVAIHLWSPDSPVGQQVVLPFIQEYESLLLGNASSAGSGRAAFDPRHQNAAEAEVDNMLGLSLKATEANVSGSAAAGHQQGSYSKSQTSEQSQSTHSDSNEAALHKAAEDQITRARKPHRRSRQLDNNRVGSD